MSDYRTCSFCGYTGPSACITREHAGECGHYKGFKVTYNWKHIPSGRTGQSTMAFHTPAEFQEQMNIWNRVGRGTWEYWR